ncbi:MAG: hypothetical protein ABSG44_02270 [Thermodesulfobacteriota bacterium]|jgi:hypothetical protein
MKTAKLIFSGIFLLGALVEVIVNGRTIWDWTQVIDPKLKLQIALAVMLVGSGCIVLCAYVGDKVIKWKKKIDTIFEQISESKKSIFSERVNTVLS